MVHLLVLMLVATGVARADIPPTPEGRAALIEAKLVDAISAGPLRTALGKTVFWRDQTVAFTVRKPAFQLTDALRRSEGAAAALSTYLADAGLRFGMTEDELAVYVASGRPAEITLASSLDVLDLPINVVKDLRTRLNLASLGDLHARAAALVHGRLGLTATSHDQLLAAIVYLKLPSDRGVLRYDQFAFIEFLDQRNVGALIHLALYVSDVTSRNEIDRIDAEKILAQKSLGKRTLGELQKLVKSWCDEDLATAAP